MSKGMLVLLGGLWGHVHMESMRVSFVCLGGCAHVHEYCSVCRYSEVCVYGVSVGEYWCVGLSVGVCGNLWVWVCCCGCVAVGVLCRGMWIRVWVCLSL